MGVWFAGLVCTGMFFFPLACVFGHMGLMRVTVFILGFWIVLSILLAQSANSGGS